MRSYLFCLFLTCYLAGFGQVEMFAPDVISNGEVFGVAMAPDASQILFVRAYGGRDTLEIHESRKVGDRWTQPSLSFFSTVGAAEIDPAFSPDGRTILFNKVSNETSGYDVYALRKTDTGWSKPEPLPGVINTEAHEFYATMSRSGNIYFTRRMESNDIYVSFLVDGVYQKAVPLPGFVNTAESDSNPYISPSEDFLILASRKESGMGGADLYVSFQKNGEWSAPVNLGSPVNTEFSDFCPSMDIKNDRFMFSRTERIGERRIENIYSIPLKDLRLKKLRKSATWGQ